MVFKTTQLYRCPHCKLYGDNFWNCEICGRNMSVPPTPTPPKEK